MNKLTRYLISQFGHPRGMLGELVGFIMASRKSNLERNEWSIRLLELKPEDEVLEIGPGPGVTLQKILSHVTRGKVVALDHSQTMLSQCRRRNKKAIQQGLLQLIEGDYTKPDEIPGKFDKILAVNSLQFSGINDAVLKSIHGHLKPGGRLAITFQPRGQNPTNEAGQKFADTTRDRLLTAGFTGVQTEVLEMEPINAFCLLAKV